MDGLEGNRHQAGWPPLDAQGLLGGRIDHSCRRKSHEPLEILDRMLRFFAVDAIHLVVVDVVIEILLDENGLNLCH